MTVPATLVALVMGAAFAGAFLGEWCARRLDKRKVQPKPVTVRPLVQPPADLDEEAARWARQHGYPEEAIPLVADKARLIHRIVHSRRYRGGQR